MPLKIFKQINKSLTGEQQQLLFQDHHTHLEHLQQDSPLLGKRPLTPIAPLERDEVHTIPGDKGIALGGGFYNACAVSRICLRERRQSQSDELQSERQALADRSAQEEKGFYSIKFLSKKTIKRLQADKQLLVQSMTNLLVEANYLTKFQHPHILTAHGMHNATNTATTAASPTATLSDMGCFLITERLADTLEERLEKWQAEHAKNPTAHAVDPKCPTFATKLEYALQIAQALEYLHQRQILVLGLQPSSIGFLARSGRLQLCDLGTCREIGAFEAAGKGHSPLGRGGPIEDDDLKFGDDEIGDGERFVQGAVVTEEETDALLIPMLETGVVPRYTAPEIVTTQRAESASARADVYSWAMVCVEMITLQKAFSHYRKGEYLIKVCVEGKRPNLAIYPNLPQAMESVLRRCWRHAQEKRWNSTQVVEAMQKIIGKQVPVGNTNTSSNISRKQKDTGNDMAPAPPQPRLSRSTSVPSVPTTERRISSGVPTNIGIVMDQSAMRNSLMSHSSSRRRSSNSAEFAPLLGMGDGSLMQQSMMGQSSNSKNSERRGSISSQRRELRRSKRSTKIGEDQPLSMKNLLAMPRSSPAKGSVFRSKSDCHQLGKMSLQVTAEKKRHSDAPPKKQKTLRRTKSDDKEGAIREAPRRTKSSEGVIGGILAAAFGDSSAYAAVPSRSKSPRRGRRSDSKKAPKKLDAKWDNAVGNASMESSHHSQISFSLENTSNHEASKSKSPARPKRVGVRSISLGEAPQLEAGWDAFGNQSAQWSSSDMKVSLQKISSHSKKERSKSPRRPKSGDSKTKAKEMASWDASENSSTQGSNSQRGFSLQSNSNHKKDRSKSPGRRKIGEGRSKSLDDLDAFGGGSLRGRDSELGILLNKGSNHQTTDISKRSSTHEKKTTKRSSKCRKRGSSVGNASMHPSNGLSLENSNHGKDTVEPGMETVSPPSSLEKKPLKRRSSNRGTRRRESQVRVSDRQLEAGTVAQDERRRSSKSSNTDHTPEDASKRPSKSSKSMKKTASGESFRKMKSPHQRQSLVCDNTDYVNLAVTAAESDAAARTATESTVESTEAETTNSARYARSDTLDKKEPRRRTIVIDMDASATTRDTEVDSEPHVHSRINPPRRTMSAACIGDRRPTGRYSVPNRKQKGTPMDAERPSMSRAMSFGFRRRHDKVDHAAVTGRNIKEV